MKFKLIALALLLSGLKAFSQTNNNISVYWTRVKADMFTGATYGDFGYTEFGSSAQFGIDYEHKYTAHWAIQTGLQYTDANFLISYYSSLATASQKFAEHHVITIPVLAKVTFGDIFFLNGGVVGSIEPNAPQTDLNGTQTGLGIQLGTGFQYNFNRLRILVSPYLQIDNIVSFSSASSHYDLLNSGWKFGLGYNF